MKNNEKINNCKNNTEKAVSQTFDSFFDKVNKIANELENKSHKYHDLYSHMYNEIPTIHLEINPEGNIDKISEPVKDYSTSKTSDAESLQNTEINWCSTCEGTTLKDCLECVGGNKNPNWKMESSLKNEDEVNNVEKHFFETVKKAKTEDLEKIYDAIVNELGYRYLSDEKKEDTDNKCDECNECNCHCVEKSSDKKSITFPQDKAIQGKLYYRKNGEEPLEVKVELSEDDIKEIKEEVETEINKAVNDIISRFRMFRYFEF